MVAVPNLSCEDLVLDRSDTFQVRTDVYMDREVFEAEIRNVLERTWVDIAHESEISAVGDHKTSIIGRQPIIVSRHEDERVYVLLNRCRHRGAVVCRDALGRSDYFRRPYHNWALDGMPEALNEGRYRVEVVGADDRGDTRARREYRLRHTLPAAGRPA